jgi:hypothetical protein
MSKRKDFVAPITDMELLLGLRPGAMNNNPGWEILEFYETCWRVIKDDMFILYNQTSTRSK